MELEMRHLEIARERGVNIAAALAARQVEYALQIARTLAPGASAEHPLVAALVVAIATNYGAAIGSPSADLPGSRA